MTAHVRQGPGRQPRRDRLPHHAHAAPAGHRARSRSTPRPTPTRLHVAPGRRGGLHRPGARRRELPRRRNASSRPRAQTGAEAIHPGYGFLSENADFAERCEAAGIAFIGPTPGADARLRPQAHGARARRGRAACRCCRAPACSRTSTQALREAARIGYPVMLKSTAGGGGIGMRRCADAAELGAAFDAVRRLARAATSSDAGRLPREVVAHARHVEVQIFGDGSGQVIALGERDCSLQRRNQKVIEETPAPGLRAAMRAAAAAPRPRRLGEAVDYRSAGTVEFVYDAARGAVLLPRGQHAPAGRARRHRGGHGVDLVEWMVRLAAGELPRPRRAWQPRRAAHAIQARALRRGPGARLPAQRRPADRGRASPRTSRVETWVEPGTEVHAATTTRCSPR